MPHCKVLKVDGSSIRYTVDKAFYRDVFIDAIIGATRFEKASINEPHFQHNGVRYKLVRYFPNKRYKGFMQVGNRFVAIERVHK